MNPVKNATPAPNLESLAQRPNLQLAQAGSIVIGKFGASTSIEDLEVLGQHQLAVAGRSGPITMISLVPVDGSVGRISDDVRQKSVEIMTKLGKSCIGSATVVLGSGLGATVVRMFLTGFSLVSRTPYPQKAFSSVRDALVWAQQLPEQNVAAKQLTSDAVVKHFGLKDHQTP